MARVAAFGKVITTKTKKYTCVRTETEYTIHTGHASEHMDITFPTHIQLITHIITDLHHAKACEYAPTTDTTVARLYRKTHEILN